MITFIKTLAYVTKPQEAAFEYVTQLLRHDIDPPSSASASISIPEGIVFHSPHNRVVETLDTESGATYKSLRTLCEVPFDVSDELSRDQWHRSGSTAVREIFKKLFIADALLETRGDIFTDIEILIKNCREWENSTVVTHSFRLKLIEIYLQTRGEIVHNPLLIHEYMSSTQKGYIFGGYVTDTSCFK